MAEPNDVCSDSFTLQAMCDWHTYQVVNLKAYIFQHQVDPFIDSSPAEVVVVELLQLLHYIIFRLDIVQSRLDTK